MVMTPKTADPEAAVVRMDHQTKAAVPGPAVKAITAEQVTVAILIMAPVEAVELGRSAPMQRRPREEPVELEWLQSFPEPQGSLVAEAVVVVTGPGPVALAEMAAEELGAA